MKNRVSGDISGAIVVRLVGPVMEGVSVKVEGANCRGGSRAWGFAAEGREVVVDCIVVEFEAFPSNAF